MKIVSFTDHFHLELWRPLSPLLVNMEANKPYLLADIQFTRIQESPAATLFHKISDVVPVAKPFRPEDPKIRRVLLYNGCGGLGDQVMTWPIPKILHDRGYEVHVLSDPQHDQSWHGFPWIHSIVTLPAYWGLIESFDAHLFFESISNSYIHEGQVQPVDGMLRLLGIDPASVPASAKCVAPVLTPVEKRLAEIAYPGKRIGFYQLSASQTVRSPTPEQSVAILLALAENFPEIHWIAIYGAIMSAEYTRLVPESLTNVEVREFEKIRVLWTMLSRAEICVGPDSMLMHVAGALGRPTVGIWGVHSPSCRVAYYPQHEAIYHREVCPNSPCNWNGLDLPRFCPPPILRGTRQNCEVVLHATPEEVVEAVRGKLSDVG